MLEKLLSNTRKAVLSASLALMPLYSACGGESNPDVDAGTPYDAAMVDDCAPIANAGPDLELPTNNNYCFNFSDGPSELCQNPPLPAITPEGHEYGTGSKTRCDRTWADQVLTVYPSEKQLRYEDAIILQFNETGERTLSIELTDSEGATSKDSLTLILH